MAKKSIMIVLSFVMVASVVTFATAYPFRPGGWNVYYGSICVDSTWVGVGDYEKEPSVVEVTLEPLEVQVHYLNPAGNPGGIGEPFYPGVTLEGLDKADNQSVTKNGKFESTVCFDQDDLIPLIEASSYYSPPNDGWTIDPEDGVEVLKLRVTLTGYANLDDDLTTGVIVTDEDGNEYQSGAEKVVAVVTGTCDLVDGEYLCGTDETWVYKKNDPDYTPSP